MMRWTHTLLILPFVLLLGVGHARSSPQDPVITSLQLAQIDYDMVHAALLERCGAEYPQSVEALKAAIARWEDRQGNAQKELRALTRQGLSSTGMVPNSEVSQKQGGITRLLTEKMRLEMAKLSGSPLKVACDGGYATHTLASPLLDFSALLAKMRAANQGDSPGRHSYPLRTDATPALGNIAGIKLSIPHNYLLSGVHYKGEEVWTRSQAPPPPRTFASEIEDFALLLRQCTLQPVKTEQDWTDYLEFGRTAHPRPDNRWLTMSFFPARYRTNEGTLQPVFDQYMKDEAHWGPFVSQEVDVYGLKHAVSSKPEKQKTSVVETDEFFYDSTTWDTFITCSNYHRAVAPFDPLSNCKHSFIVPELKVVATTHYEKGDLFRWREIEREIKKMAHSFIVE